MLNQAVGLLGRVLLSAIFLWAGFNKAISPDATIASFTKLSVANPPLAYTVTLAVELLAGAAVLVGWKTRCAALALAIWCGVTALAVHYHPGDRGQMLHFMKNLCMAGGFLQLFVLGGGRFSLDRR